MTSEPLTLDHLLAHQSWALRIARQLVREENEAEELVQRTWIAAMKRPPNDAQGTRAWIRRVIQNLARERHRRSDTRRRHELAGGLRDGLVADASDDAARAEIRELLADRLLALPEPYRSTLTLRYYEDLTSVEIARLQGVPDSTVRWRLKVGLDQLREELDRRCHGERERWVSALFLLGPIGPVPPALERDALRPAPAAPWSLLGAGGLLLSIAVAWLAWSRTRAPHASSPTPSALAALDTRAPAPPLSAPALRLAEELPTTEPLTAAVLPPDASRGLAVRVADENGRPLAGATIRVATRDGWLERATTDGDGLAQVPWSDADVGALGLLPTRGRLALQALAAGRAASPLWLLAPPFVRATPFEFVLSEPEQPLRGRVTDAHGTPLEGVLLAWYEIEARVERYLPGDFPGPSVLTTTTDADGHFLLAHARRAGQSLFLFKPGYALASTRPTPEEQDLELVLRAGARVRGRILGPDGRPAVGVRVGTEPLQKASEWAALLATYDPTRRGFPEQTTTDEQGRYELPHVGAGRRTLWAGGTREGVASTVLELADGQDEPWDASLAAGGALHLALVDGEGQPLPDWLLVLRRPGGKDTWWVRHLVSDADGRVDLFECPEGDLYLDVFDRTGLGSTYLSQKLVADGRERVLRVETRARASLHGLLLDHAGLPELDGELRLYARRTALAQELARDARGAFELELAPGIYSLVFTDGVGAAPLGRFELAAGEVRDFGSLVLPAFGYLNLESARLANGSARTPSYALAALFEDGARESLLHTSTGDLSGDVRLELYPGRYRVTLFDGAGGAALLRDVTIESFAEVRAGP